MIPDRYTYAKLKKAIRNPNMFLSEFHRINRSAYHRLVNVCFHLRHGKGIDVIQQDWDNLIILDACRYDHFKEVVSLDGNLQPVTSRGSHSWEFMEKNFLNRELHDIVYITANPNAYKLPDGTFHYTDILLDRWDEEIGTVHPDSVVEAAVDSIDDFDDKRFIIHFMQPHQPFLGSTAQECRNRVDLKGFNPSLYEDWKEDGDAIIWWDAVKQGHISHEESHQAHKETIEIVMESVADLLDALNGKSIVTADHGDLIGEKIVPFGKRYYSHPHEICTPKLCRVPWFEISSDTRRETTEEPPVNSTEIDQATVDKRLQALGYKP